MNDEFIEHAQRIFPNSIIVSTENYGKAKDRMLNWIRTLSDWMDPVSRWALACCGAHDVTITGDDMHKVWAQQLLDTDLTNILNKLHEGGIAKDYPSSNPTTWPNTPDFSFSHKMDESQVRMLKAQLS